MSERRASRASQLPDSQKLNATGSNGRGQSGDEFRGEAGAPGDAASFQQRSAANGKRAARQAAPRLFRVVVTELDQSVPASPGSGHLLSAGGVPGVHDFDVNPDRPLPSMQPSLGPL